MKTVENKWILDEYTRWTSPPLSFVTPMQEGGKKILMTLMKLGRPILSKPRNDSTIRFGHYEASIRPSLSHCIQDLFNIPAGSVITPINFIHSVTAQHIQAADIVASVMTTTDRSDWVDGRPLLGALSIPFTTHGLGKCNLTAHPYDSDKRYLCARTNDGKLDWYGVLTPAGAISHPHIDYHGASQLMHHISGRKLWLTWPATARNMKMLLDRELRDGNPIETVEAIEVLEGLEVFLLDETQEAFYLPSGMIHAAISLSTCCHAGLYVWALDEFPLARDLVEYHVSISTEPIAEQTPNTVDFLDVFCRDFDGQELGKWETLASANAQDDHHSDILEWVRQTREKLGSLLKSRMDTGTVHMDEMAENGGGGKKRKNRSTGKKGSKRGRKQ